MTFQTQFPQLLQRIKADSPLIHCITNHISIHDYICQVRLENGCRLLRGTSLSIGEIAFSCGYGDQNYFTRAFCRTYGMTPMQYRKKETI